MKDIRDYCECCATMRTFEYLRTDIDPSFSPPTRKDVYKCREDGCGCLKQINSKLEKKIDENSLDVHRSSGGKG